LGPVRVNQPPNELAIGNANPRRKAGLGNT
jgi:hypothetical protein